MVSAKGAGVERARADLFDRADVFDPERPTDISDLDFTVPISAAEAAALAAWDEQSERLTSRKWLSVPKSGRLEPLPFTLKTLKGKVLLLGVIHQH
jgi:hypothetical protein